MAVWLSGAVALGQEGERANRLEGGKVHARSFVGPVTKKTIHYTIYLPRDYASIGARYPVVYHLHGLGGDHHSDHETVVEQLQEAVDADVMPPAIVVFPSGYRNSMWADSKNGEKPAETNVVRELIPHVDATYRTLTQRESRVIQGFSMGGYGACALAVKYPDLFSVCVNYDGALHDWESLSARRTSIAEEIFEKDGDYYDRFSPWANARRNLEQIKDRVAFLMAVGALRPFNEHYNKHLAELGIRAKYVETGCDHDLDCIMTGQGHDEFAFIAEHLAGDQAK